MTLRWEDRAFHDRVMRDYRSRPQGRGPHTKPEDIERPDVVELMIDFLAREANMSVDELDATRAERFDVAEELGADRAFAERFPDPLVLINERFKMLPKPAVVCRCGTALVKNLEDRWCHAYSSEVCTTPEPAE